MRFYYMAVIIAGVLLLLNLGGITTPTGSLIEFSGLVDPQGNLTIEDFKSSDLVGDFNNPSNSPTNSLAWILGGILVAGLVLGLFGKAPDIRYITAAFVALITGILMTDLIWLFTYVQSLGVAWITKVTSLLIGTSLIGLVITAVQFWQGSD